MIHWKPIASIPAKGRRDQSILLWVLGGIGPRAELAEWIDAAQLT